MINLTGIMLFGLILINLLFKPRFQNLDLRKIEENEAFFAIFLCFLGNLMLFIFAGKKLKIIKTSQFIDFQRVTKKLFNRLFEKDKENMDLLHNSLK